MSRIDKKKIIISAIIILMCFGIFIYQKTKRYEKARVSISLDSQVTSRESINITMKSKKKYRIYYTLDGSIPNSKSIRYKNKIKLNRNSDIDYKDDNKLLLKNNSKDFSKAIIVRARAIAPNGKKGPIENRTYFIGENLWEKYKDIKILSLVSNPKGLFDNKIGIMSYNNYTKKGREWERDVYIEMFEKGKVLTFGNAGIRLKGNVSRTFSQKSFNIYFRKDYGNKKLKYKLLEDCKDIDGEVISKYKSFTLRNGGNETDFIKYKDQWLQDLVRDRNIDTQTGEPVIVFLNGDYWGIYNLQEKYSDNYYATHYKVDKDNVVVIKEEEVEEGKDSDIELYNKLMEYAEKDLTDNEIYNEFLNVVDINSMLDYYAIEVYIGNADWGKASEKDRLNNTQLWRVREPDGTKYGDGKWRWSLYDLEYSSSLYKQEMTNYDYDSIERAKNNHSLFKSAMNNQEFRKNFYKVLGEIGSKNFDVAKINESLDRYEETWIPYMNEYYKRFGVKENLSYYSSQEEGIKEIREGKLSDIKEYFQKRYRYIMNY